MSTSPYRRAPLTVDVGAVHTTVPYRPAAEWLDVLMEAGTAGLIPELAEGAGRTALVRALARREIDADQLMDAGHALLKLAVPDFDWWAAERLLVLATRTDVAGALTLRGVDTWSVPVALLCATVHTLFTESSAPKDRFKFEGPLLAPPAGIEDDGFGAMTIEQMAAQARATPGMR